jgi:hypothetical protein
MFNQYRFLQKANIINNNITILFIGESIIEEDQYSYKQGLDSKNTPDNIIGRHFPEVTSKILAGTL